MFIGIDPDIENISVAYLDKDNNLKINYGKIIDRKEIEADMLLSVIADKAYAICSQVLYHQLTLPAIQRKITVCIEGQNIAYTGRTTQANPNDLIGTAQISGVFMGVIKALCRYMNIEHRIHVMLPQRWKGSIQKHITQARAYNALNIPYEQLGGKSPYIAPVDVKPLLFSQSEVPVKSAFKDISDSLALAYYCKKQFGR